MQDVTYISHDALGTATKEPTAGKKIIGNVIDSQ
jgi:hypothetical protein